MTAVFAQVSSAKVRWGEFLRSSISAMSSHNEMKTPEPKNATLPCPLFAAVLFAVCISTAGCTSDTLMAQNDSCLKGDPWQAVGNNGGKADRFAVARLAASCASEEKR
jgi:hypothetical protein